MGQSSSTISNNNLLSNQSSSISSSITNNHSYAQQQTYRNNQPTKNEFPLPHNIKLYELYKEQQELNHKSLSKNILQYISYHYKTCINSLHVNHNLNDSKYNYTDDYYEEEDEDDIKEEDDYEEYEDGNEIESEYKYLEELFNDGSKEKHQKIPTWCMMGIDRINFNRYILQPHIIPPGGILDCFFYAFSSETMAMNNTKASYIYLADILFLLHIIIYGTKNQKQQIVFMIYNSYQKSGAVSKDTIKRFLSAIYGNDILNTIITYQQNEDTINQNYNDLLLNNDSFITSENNGMEKELEYNDFVQYQDKYDIHDILLSWFDTFINSWIPLGNKISIGKEQKATKSIKKKKNSILYYCKLYSLTKMNLYEIKRKFHVLSQKSITYGKTKKSNILYLSYLHHKCQSSGYISLQLASDLFYDNYWMLKHVLHFGCKMVRCKDDEDIYSWFYECLLHHNQNDKKELNENGLCRFIHWIVLHHLFRKDYNDVTESENKLNINASNGLIYDYNAWISKEQQQTNNRITNNIENHQNTIRKSIIINKEEDYSKYKISSELAKEIGFMPSNASKEISYATIMKSLFEETSTSLPQFTATLCKTKQILISLILDLKLISGILFGIKPLQSPLEYTLIQELVSRHKKYHPTTNTRRGPPGTKWFIVHSTWWKRWCVYATSSEEEEPNEISNNILLKQGSLALKTNLKLRTDFELIPPSVWYALQSWYDGGPPIYRTVVQRKTKNGTNSEIELYPLFLTISLLSEQSGNGLKPFQQSVPVSKILSLGNLLSSLLSSFKQKNARLWRLSDWYLLDLSCSINDMANHLQDNDCLVLEIIRDNNTWIRNTTNIPINEQIALRKSSLTSSQTKEIQLGDGIIGLYNMGNTCYLNSSIQCLSHTPLLREYFTSKSYLKDINTTNTMGYQGRLAQSCAVLIHSLWKMHGTAPPQQKQNNQPVPLNVPSITPKHFKDALSKFSDHFAGNEQHDAQELLSFLLSGLSEDLNRIHDRIYIEQPDSDGLTPNSELANIWWKNHLRREMSIIVALFTGQYKSLLTCKECDYKSARFEPFGFLQLPLPEDDFMSINVIYIPLEYKENVCRYSIKVNASENHGGCTIFDCLKALAKTIHEKEDEMCTEYAQNMAVVDIRENRIVSITPTNRNITQIQCRDVIGDIPLLYVYQLDPLPNSNEDNVEKSDTSDDDNDYKQSSKVDDNNEVNDESKEALEEQSTSIASSILPQSRPSYIAIAQRKLETNNTHSNKPYLFPYTMTTFNSPLLLRIVDLDGYTGRDIYDLIAQRICRFICSDHDCMPYYNHFNDDVMIEEDHTSKRPIFNRRDVILPHQETKQPKTTIDDKNVNSGSFPRYGFRLRLATRDGKRCSICPWYECCIGCIIPDDDYPTIVQDGDTIALDWHTSILSNTKFDLLNKQSNAAFNNISKHISFQDSNGYNNNSITLEECLDAFAQEERIPEAYCSKCKDFRISTKQMSIWRLPPIMIIHLKRFQFTQHMKRKLRNLVVFPTEGLDLSRIVDEESLDSTSTINFCMKEDESVASDSSPTSSKMKQSESITSLHSISSESLYDLYAVIHHQGALSGGHYVASLRSEIDDRWRLFNDAQVYDISSKEIVDATAYILFYIRRDVKNVNITDFWDTSCMDGTGVTEEQIDKLVKHRERCVLS